MIKLINLILFSLYTSPRGAFQHGIEEQVHDETQRALFSTIQYNARIFKSKEEYIDEFSGAHNLDFGYFEEFFKLFFSINLLNLLFFGFVILYKKLHQKNYLKKKSKGQIILKNNFKK